MTEGDLGHVLGLVYDAAADHRRWSAAIEAVAEFLDADGASLSVDLRHAQRSLNTGAGEEILRGYDAHWHRINPLWPGALAAPTGAVLIDRRALDWGVYRRSVFYNDFVRARGADGCMAVKVLESRAATAAIVVHRVRGRADRAFGDRQARRAALLAPHLARAVRMSERLADLREAAGLTAQALDHLAGVAFVVDARARLLLANRRAEALLREADGLSHGPDGLCAARPATTAELRRLVAGAAAPGGPGSLGRQAAVRLERPSGRVALSALVGPFRAAGGWDLLREGGATAIVLVRDPGQAAGPGAPVLRRLYGLTPAEAALALALLEGGGARGAAERLGVSLTTARSHLRQVFGKTGTGRQAELVRLLLTTPGEAGGG